MAALQSRATPRKNMKKGGTQPQKVAGVHPLHWAFLNNPRKAPAMNIEQDLMDLSARLSTQRFLIEQMYASQFLANPSDFDTFAEQLIVASSSNVTQAEPIADEDVQELKVRMRTHMIRFCDSVKLRLKQGPWK